MAIDATTKLLDIAKKVLKLETIASILSIQGITNYGLKILDRWALNSPERLQGVEQQKGALAIEMLLLQQQRTEKAALDTPSAWDARDQGMSDWEILELAGVDTELPVLL